MKLARCLVVVAALMASIPVGVAAHATSGTLTNVIQRENSLPGTTSWEITSPSEHNEIEGYASRQSVAPGKWIKFAVSTKGSYFMAEIYRIGWYRGAGGRLMRAFSHIAGHRRQIPKPHHKTGLLVCTWPYSISIKVPNSWVSGIYLVKLTSSDGHQSYIPFAVRESRPAAPLLLVDAVTTSEAYNWWGSKSLYVDVNYKRAGQQYQHRAVMVSFDRPFAQNAGAGWFLSWEIHMVRWLERRGYDVGYADDLDVNDNPKVLLHRKGIIIAGHDEYWSLAMRDAMNRAVTSGVNLANFAANTGYWQIRLKRLGPNPDAIEICYKSFKRDPIHRIHPRLATVLWRSSQIHRPESKLLGAMYEDYEGHYGPFPWVVKKPKTWVFAGTNVRKGTAIKHIVGHEEDAVLPGYPHPHHLHKLSASPVFDSAHQRRISNSTIYRSRSGATVFNAGAIDWSYGLDDVRQGWWDYPPARKHPSRVIERVTGNILKKFLTGSRSSG